MMQFLLEKYQLDTNATIEPIGNGLINTTYKIITPANEEFILQKINTAIFKNPNAIAYNIKSIGSYLAQEYPDYLFVQPIALANGDTMLLYQDNYYRVFPFVNNSYSKDVLTNPHQAYEAAAQFGKFTKLLSGFDCTQLQITLPNFHNLTLRYQQFEAALLQGNPERIKECQAEIHYLQAQQIIVATYNQIVQNNTFQLRVTHHDTKISNVLFRNNTALEKEKAICVIDLDTMMPGYFISDLGDMFRTYLCPVNEEETDLTKIEIRKDYYDAIIQGYLEQMQEVLTPTEKQYLHYAGSFMIYMQAIRFLTDYLNDDVYYGAKYKQHNYNRAKNQIALLQKYNALH